MDVVERMQMLFAGIAWTGQGFEVALVDENGRVDGDVTTFAGNMRIDKQVTINGDVTLLGGRLHRDPAATVGGG